MLKTAVSGAARISAVPKARPRALDLFCGAGGASMGLHRAGYDVIGVDIIRQPRYPFPFVQDDALRPPFDLRQFDLLWASPPCQAHTALKTMHHARQHLNLIPATRAMLQASGVPYIIENVVGAPLINPITLCGTMFGLGVDDAELRRHRIFETSFPVLPRKCRHGGAADVLGVYGGHVRNRRRRQRTVGIYGEGCRDSRRKVGKGVPDFSIEQGRDAMGIDWMTTAELSQAVPPDYAEYLGLMARQVCQTPVGTTPSREAGGPTEREERNVARTGHRRRGRGAIARGCGRDARRVPELEAIAVRVPALEARIRELEAHHQPLPAPAAAPQPRAGGRKSMRAAEREDYIVELEMRNEELEPWETRGPELEARVRELEESGGATEVTAELEAEVTELKKWNGELEERITELEEIEHRYKLASKGKRELAEMLVAYKAKASNPEARNEAFRRWLREHFGEGWERKTQLNEPRGRLLCAMAATPSEGRAYITPSDPSGAFTKSLPFNIAVADRVAAAIGATAKAILTVIGELSPEQCDDVRERFF